MLLLLLLLWQYKRLDVQRKVNKTFEFIIIIIIIIVVIIIIIIVIIIIIIIIITFIIYYYDFLGAEHFEELVSVVKEHCLFKEALKLYPKSSEQYRVCTLSLLFRPLRRFPLTY